MDEKEQEEAKRKAEEEAKESAKQKGEGDSSERDKPKTPQSIIDALAAAERLEKATAKHKEQLDRQEDMISRKILGGDGGGNVEIKEVSKEQKKVDDAKEFFKDTALGDAIGKANE